MGLKHHTIIVVPHSRARFRKWRVSDRALKTVAVLLVGLTAAAGWVTWSYFTTSLSLDELTRLRGENDQLRAINESFEESVRELQDQLTVYEDRTKELAIVAGLEDVPSASARRGDSEAGAGGDVYGGALPHPEDFRDLSERASELDSVLDRVGVELQERSLWISSTPAILPVRGFFSSPYGYRRDPVTGRRSFHNGIDISAPKGQPVLATADGVVIRTGTAGSLGRSVQLSHGFGLSTRYGHLSKAAVEPGARVRRGDVIGYVGNSGRSTGYHLHYEVHEDDRARNPLAYILDWPRPRS